MSYSHDDSDNPLSIWDTNSISIQKSKDIQKSKGIQKSGSSDVTHVVGEVAGIFDQSTKADASVGIQGERASDKNDTYIRYEKPDGERLTAINRRKKSGSSFKIVISVCITFTIISVLILTALFKTSYYIVSSDGTVTAISGDAMEAASSISEAAGGSESVIVKSSGFAEKLASSVSWVLQITPYGTLEPVEGSLSTFHLLLWFNFGCLCIYLLSCVIIGITMVKGTVGRFTAVLITTMAILWIAGFIGSWLLTGYTMEHTVLGPLFVVLIDAVVGFILACVLSDVAEQCGRGK